MLFMTGMYWFAKSPDTETISIRDVRGTRVVCVVSESARAASAFSPLSGGECRSTDFDM